jgi:adenosylmethionine-8-amino-7-oxononanoate aminotransferase
LVQDLESRQWFDPSFKLHARLKAAAMVEGLLVYPMGGTVDGRCGDHVLLAPPFIASEDELDTVVARLARALDGAVLDKCLTT